MLRDGIRFLEVILSAAAYLKVSRLTVPLMAILGTIAAALMLRPALSYLRNGSLEEGMFYRVALVGMLGTVCVIALCSTIVSEHVAALTLMRYERFSPRTRGLWRYETLRTLVAVAGLFLLGGVALNSTGLIDLVTTGHVTLHWSRVMVGYFLGINFTVLTATLCTLKIIRALHRRQPFQGEDGWQRGGSPD